MIDRKLGEKPLFFEISMGNAGNIMDGHNDSQCSEGAEQSDTLREYNLHVLAILPVWLFTRRFTSLLDFFVNAQLGNSTFLNF